MHTIWDLGNGPNVPAKSLCESFVIFVIFVVRFVGHRLEYHG